MSNGATDKYGRDYDDPEYGNYGIEPGRGNSGIRPNRYEKFGKALEAAASYKQKKAAENQADAETGIFTDKDKDKDAVTPKGFKIGSDSTVVTGYRDPGFTLKGQEGRSLLGPIGAGLTPFFPITGQVVGAVGSLTGL